MNPIEVYELGIDVLIDGDIPATLTAINIRPAQSGSVRIMYEVTWWDERSRKSEWLEPFEVRPKDAKHQQIAFKPY